MPGRGILYENLQWSLDLFLVLTIKVNPQQSLLALYQDRKTSNAKKCSRLQMQLESQDTLGWCFFFILVLEIANAAGCKCNWICTHFVSWENVGTKNPTVKPPTSNKEATPLIQLCSLTAWFLFIYFTNWNGRLESLLELMISNIVNIISHINDLPQSFSLHNRTVNNDDKIISVNKLL